MKLPASSETQLPIMIVVTRLVDVGEKDLREGGR